MNIFIAAMGTGEIGQGVAFAKYAIGQGANVTFSIFDSRYLPFIDLGINNFDPVVVNEDVDSLNSAISQVEPDLLVICNSKILQHIGYCDNPPTPKPKTISIDSNWLFSEESPWKSMPWVDTYCINIPSEVFKLGLKENDGDYNIPTSVMKKIKIVGLVPSYEKILDETRNYTRNKYGISDDEKLVFVYASTTSISTSQQIGIYNKALDSVHDLRSKGLNIKVISVGGTPNGISHSSSNWLINTGRVDGIEFYNILSSSDLIFQHQGLGTLEQAISANIPIIANVKDLKDEEYVHHAHEWEVKPFARYGACSMMHFSDSLSKSIEEVERLLYDDDSIDVMKSRQSELHNRGESIVMDEANRLLSQLNS